MPLIKVPKLLYPQSSQANFLKGLPSVLRIPSINTTLGISHEGHFAISLVIVVFPSEPFGAYSCAGCEDCFPALAPLVLVRGVLPKSDSKSHKAFTLCATSSSDMDMSMSRVMQ